ncbi:MAG: C_GCAxxG_C_C family protein [Solobacterium sp.]|nr:C_GCAxxG_C_C family protein [Solobacterium sp.]
MSSMEEILKKYYEVEGYNCGETLIHTGNEYYQLGLHEEDMKMMAGFGSGMYSGSTCGALIASVAVLSKLVIKTKAHDQLDELRPVISAMVRNFKAESGVGTDCASLRPKYHTKEKRCLNTCLLAARVLEKTAKEFNLG